MYPGQLRPASQEEVSLAQLASLAWEPAVGDWVVCTCLRVVKLDGPDVMVPWAGEDDWIMFREQVRPATQEEIAQAQLASLEGL